MIVNKAIPAFDILNSIKKSATMWSTLSMTSNETMTRKITKVLVLDLVNEKKIFFRHPYSRKIC
jgi:hypothetical protein